MGEGNCLLMWININIQNHLLNKWETSFQKHFFFFKFKRPQGAYCLILKMQSSLTAPWDFTPLCQTPRYRTIDGSIGCCYSCPNSWAVQFLFDTSELITIHVRLHRDWFQDPCFAQPLPYDVYNRVIAYGTDFPNTR